jgi:hypothetical protein
MTQTEPTTADKVAQILNWALFGTTQGGAR